MNIRLLLFSILCFNYCPGQISRQGYPEGMREETQLAPLGEFEVLPLLNNETLNNNPQLSPQEKVLEFAYVHDVNFDLNNGSWTSLSDGRKIWRLGITSVGAYSLNLTFSKFDVPQGAQVYIYSTTYNNYLGAFTDFNNHSEGFGTAPLPGDELIVEYIIPANINAIGNIRISGVAHDYKDIFKMAKSFGSSGSCNVNVKCDQGLGWENEISSVAMITTAGGSRICTGSMVGNTRNDSTPYFLTANHCIGGGTASWVFIFNYQSPTCTPVVDGMLNQSVSGCQISARNSASDFALLRLNAVPPVAYGVKYNGWDKSGQNPLSQVGIHHPSGDIKKISFDNDPASTSGNFWQIDDWDEGTTEGGSSGSPLFNSQKKVIGQLYGGWAACGNNEWDQYGKFSVSWDGADSSVRLRDWLDPDQIGVDSLMSYDPHLSIGEMKRPNDVKAYPNPSDGVFTIVSGKENIEGYFLYDVTGRLISTGKDAYNSRLLSLDLSSYGNGIYLIMLKTRSGMASLRLLKS